MYSLSDSPSFFRELVQPFVQLELKFDTYAAPSKDNMAGGVEAAKTPADIAEPKTSDPQAAHKSLALFRTLATEEEDKAAAAAAAEAAATAAKTAAVLAATGLIPTPGRTRQLSEHPRIQVLILQDTTLNSLGHPVGGDSKLVDYCCTESLFDLKVPGCDQVGTMIRRDGVGIVHKVIDAVFLPAHPNTAWIEGTEGRFDVTTTGEHILIITNCDSRLADMNTHISGTGIWKNPYGYLPGRLFGFLPFYLSMCFVYAAFVALWMGLNLKHRKDVAPIQHYISVVLALTLVEVICWFVDYNNFNLSGVRHQGGVITAIVFSVLRLTVSRMLVVAVSSGFPVVRPSLSLLTQAKIVLLGLLYFVCEASLEVVTRYSQTNATAEKWRLFLALPVAILNAAFYWWSEL